MEKEGRSPNRARPYQSCSKLRATSIESEKLAMRRPSLRNRGAAPAKKHATELRFLSFIMLVGAVAPSVKSVLRTSGNMAPEALQRKACGFIPNRPLLRRLRVLHPLPQPQRLPYWHHPCLTYSLPTLGQAYFWRRFRCQTCSPRGPCRDPPW